MAADSPDEVELRAWAFAALDRALAIATGRLELQQMEGWSLLQVHQGLITVCSDFVFLVFKSVSAVAYSLYPIPYSIYHISYSL